MKYTDSHKSATATGPDIPKELEVNVGGMVYTYVRASVSEHRVSDARFWGIMTGLVIALAVAVIWTLAAA